MEKNKEEMVREERKHGKDTKEKIIEEGIREKRRGKETWKGNGRG